MMILFLIFAALLAASLAIVLLPVWQDAQLSAVERKRFVVIVGSVFILGTAGIYTLIGAPQIVPMMQEREGKMAELKASILRNSAEIKANPKNLSAWMSLGQSFMETGQFSAAANAFRESVKLSKGNPLLILTYASALIYDANGTITDEAKKSLEMVLLQQPENPEARYLLAVRALQDGNTQEAMKSMKALYASLPPDSPMRAMIDKQIGKK